MKSVRQATNDPTTEHSQMGVCDAFYFLRDAVSASGALGAAAPKSGLEHLGTTSLSAATYSVFLGSRNDASAGVLRDLEFRSDMKNFVYVTTTDYRA